MATTSAQTIAQAKAQLASAQTAYDTAQASYIKLRSPANLAAFNAAKTALASATTSLTATQAYYDKQASAAAAEAKKVADAKAVADAAAAQLAAQKAAQQAAAAEAAKLAAPQSMADAVKQLTAGGQTVDQIASYLQSGYGLTAADAKSTAQAAQPVAAPVAPTPVSTAPPPIVETAAPVAPAAPTTPQLQSSYNFMGKELYIYNDGSSYSYNPTTNQTTQLRDAGGNTTNQTVNTLPDNTYATASGKTVASADLQTQQFQAEQAKTSQAVAPTPVPAPVQPVAPTPVAPAQPTVVQAGFGSYIDPTTGKSATGTLVNFSDGSQRVYSNSSAAQFAAGTTLDKLPTTNVQTLQTTEQAAKIKSDAAAAQQAQADQQAAAVAADQAARQKATDLYNQQQAEQQAANQALADQKLAAQQAFQKQQAEQDAAAAAAAAAEQQARQQALKTAQENFTLPDPTASGVAVGTQSYTTDPMGNRYVAIPADPINNTPAQWYKVTADDKGYSQYTPIGQDLKPSGPVNPIDQSTFNTTYTTAQKDAQQYKLEQYIASIPYTTVTNYDPMSGETFETKYQTQDPYVQGYASPEDIAFKQKQAGQNQAAYQTQLAQTQQQAAAVAADQAARQAANPGSETNQQSYRDMALANGGVVVNGIAYVPNLDPASQMGVNINGQNMVNISDMYSPGFVGYGNAQAGADLAAQRNAAYARSAAAGADLDFGRVVTGLAALAAVAVGAGYLASALTAGETVAGAGAVLGETEASMAAADAMQLAAQGLGKEQIAATIAQSYGVDAATAATMADMATTTVAETGVTSETLTSQGVNSSAIQSGASDIPELIANAPTTPVIPETAIPTVDAAGNAGFYDTATGQTLDAAGNVIAEAPVVPDVPGTELAGPGGIETPVEPPVTEPPVTEPPVTDMGEINVTAPRLPTEVPLMPIEQTVIPPGSSVVAPVEALPPLTPIEQTVIPPGSNVVTPVEVPVTPAPLTPIEQTVIPPGSSEVAPVQAQQPFPADNLPPVTDAVPTPPGTPQPGLGGTTLAPITATDLALGVGGALLADKILTPEPIKPKTYEPIGPVAFGTATPPVNPGLNPGYLLAPGAISPQYSGTPTQTQYYYGQRPLIQTAADVNQFNTAVPATNPFAGAAYAQGVGPNKLDVNQFIQQYLTPEQYYALTGSSAAYPQTIASGTSYAGGPVAP